MNTSPASGVSSPAMTRRRVDLPLPLGPSSAVREPLATSTDTSSSATKSPKRFVTLRASIAMSFLPRSDHRHRNERQNRKRRQQHRSSVGPGGRTVLVGGLHVLGQRLRLAGDSAGDDRDGAELS